MSKKIGFVSAALMAAACSGGGGESAAPAPDPVGTPPPVAPPTQNMPPVVNTKDVRVQVNGDGISAMIEVTDPNGDPVDLVLIDGPDWVSLSADGALEGTPSVDDVGSYELIIEVSDGEDTTQVTVLLNLFMDPVEQAFATGDYTYITEYSDTDAPTVLLDEIAAARERNKATIAEIFQLNPDGSVREDSLTAINWFLAGTSSTGYFTSPNRAPHSKHPYTIPLFAPMRLGERTHFGILGERNEAKFLLLGDEPVSQIFNEESQRHQVVKNTINWLTESDADDSLNVVLAQIELETDQDNWRSWMSGAFPEAVTFNDPKSCDNGKFGDCITDDVDLMIISQHGDPEMAEQVEQAMNRGIPLIFVYHYDQEPELGDQMLDLLGGWNWHSNYPWQVRLSDSSPLEYLYGYEPDYFEDIEKLVQGIEAGALDYDLSACTGPIDCPENETYQQEIGDTLADLPSLLDDFDLNKVDPFDQIFQNRIVAGSLLTGDYYRSLTRFPMPTATTPSSDIIRAIFGENTALIYRKFNPVMPDMGTYSRSEFDDGLLGDETVTLTSAKPFKTSGLYALPGETVTVTRNDQTEVGVRVRIQSLNIDSGHPFRTMDGTEYRRPNRITSNWLTIEPGETIEFTSPYGGPIHVKFNEYGEEIDLAFNNVAKHPVWQGPEDTEKFLIDLSADQFDWAEFVTPFFETHSSASNMRESLANYSSPSALADAINTHLHDWPRWLSGQNGEGIRENSDLIAFHEEVGLPTQDPNQAIQHANIEQASCDNGCAGNPYDTANPLVPTCYQSVRDLGHELANELLTLPGGSANSIADLFAAHAQYQQFLETGEPSADCRPLPFEETYNLLQAAHASGDPESYMSEADFADPDRQAVFYIQMMTALQQQGAIENGWNYLPRLIVHANLVDHIYGTSTAWNEVRNGLGFAHSEFTTHNSLSRWDHTSRMLGWVAQRDISDVLGMWGSDYPGHPEFFFQTLHNFSKLQPAYYAIPPTGHCTSLDYPEIPVDGVSAWPN